MRIVVACLFFLSIFYLCSCNVQLTIDDIIGVPDSTINRGGICETNGGKAGWSGLKTWCWKDVYIPLEGPADEHNLYIDSEGNDVRQVFNDGKRIRFDLQNTNKRAEIRTAPYEVKHTLGTEEWFGWNYTFSPDYIIDKSNEWIFFQVHHAVVGDSPQLALHIASDNENIGSTAGEILIANNAISEDYLTGIIPKAGETLDIVVHVIWGKADIGLLQIWINDVIVYDNKVKTVYSHAPWGGNAKWGIYKWPWADEINVQKSLDQGITNVETSMGPLRIITRFPNAADYGENSYSLVAP